MPSSPRRVYLPPDKRGTAQWSMHGRRGVLLFFALFVLSGITLALAMGIAQAQTGTKKGANDSKANVGATQQVEKPQANVPLPHEGQEGVGTETVSPDRQGGPDGFGYVYSDDRDPGGPIYNWIPGTQRIGDTAWQNIHTSNVGAPYDDGVITYTLPFVYNFYGSTYTQIHISTNGNAHFGLPNDYYPSLSNQCLPTTSEFVPKALIAPLFFDFVSPLITETIQTGGLYTDIVGTAPNRIYVVEWRNFYKYGDASTRATMEMLLYEGSNDIVFQYQALSGAGTTGSNGVVGIQNSTGTVGLPYLCYQADLSANRAIRYRVQQDVFLQPGSRSGGGAPGATVTYTESVVNATGINNSFNLSVPSSVWTTTVDPANTGTIASGARADVTVRVQIPPGTSLGSRDSARLNVSSTLPTQGAYTDTALITTTVSTQGVDFAPVGQTKAGDYGDPITFTTSLINRSGQNNTFAMSLDGVDWTADITPDLTGSMAPDASTPVTVTVHVPAGASLGSSDVITVTATGQAPSPGQYFGQTVLTSTAGIWERQSDMPLPRSREAAASFAPNGRLYVLGGEYNNGSNALPIGEYDPASDTWADRTYLNTGVSNVGAGVIGNVIYVPGGYSGQSATTQSILQAYYPLEDRVETITSDPLPAPRFGAGVAVSNGKLYVIGGSDDTLQAKSTVYEYDPARAAGSRWQTKTAMPTARVYLAAATLNGIIYAAGGVPGGFTDLATVEAYNPATNTWTTVQSMNTPRGGLAAVGVNTGVAGCGGYLYVVGGGYLNYKASAERYDPVTNSWMPVSSLTLARRTLAAAYSPNTYSLEAFGGWDGTYEARSESILCTGGLQPPSPTPVIASPTATATPGPCITGYQDVLPGSTFYDYVMCLTCQGILGGYACGGVGEPCQPSSQPYFRPNNAVTRGQLAKIVSEVAGFSDPVSGQTFEDVLPGSTFYTYTERLAIQNIMSGYACGGVGEPCVPPDNRPYFRPNNTSTRGQVTKIVSNAANYTDPVSGQTFQDVVVGSTFYTFTERLALHDIMDGYACGGVGEPCVPPDNRPYFRPNSSLTRGQTSKVVHNTFSPSCTP